MDRKYGSKFAITVVENKCINDLFLQLRLYIFSCFPVSSYECNCTDTGFRGVNCSENIDDCDPDPCQHGATCVDGIKVWYASHMLIVVSLCEFYGFFMISQLRTGYIVPKIQCNV